MKPQIILHNQISLNGALNGFPVDMGIYYRILSSFQPDGILVGTDTIISGIKMFAVEIPEESEKDKIKPAYSDSKPWCIIPDSRGRLKGILHFMRSSGYYRDILLLISSVTSQEYVSWLKERNYEYILAGSGYVKYPEGMEILYGKYGIRTIVTDTGPTLSRILLEQGLIEKISLIVSPLLVNNQHVIFENLNREFRLELQSCAPLEQQLVHLQYKIHE